MLPSHVHAVKAILRSCTPEMGGHLAKCPRCESEHLLYHSCRHRACPRCGHDTTTRWLAEQRELLLPVPYFHVVFTLPAELRRLVRSHQAALLPVLFRAAFTSLARLGADPHFLGGGLAPSPCSTPGRAPSSGTLTSTCWCPAAPSPPTTARGLPRPPAAGPPPPPEGARQLFRGRFLYPARALRRASRPGDPLGQGWSSPPNPSSRARRRSSSTSVATSTRPRFLGAGHRRYRRLHGDLRLPRQPRLAAQDHDPPRGRVLAPLPPARPPPGTAPRPRLRPTPPGAPRHSTTTPARAGAAASARVAQARAAATTAPALSALPAGVPGAAPPALPRRVRHMGECRRRRLHRPPGRASTTVGAAPTT